MNVLFGVWYVVLFGLFVDVVLITVVPFAVVVVVTVVVVALLLFCRDGLFRVVI